MLRLVGYFLVVAAVAAGLSWLADNPGTIVVNWQGVMWDTNVFQVAIVLALLAVFLILAWSALRSVWRSPAAIGNFFNRRREKRGLEALSSGMIAIGAGDKSLATRYAVQARKSLPNEPMTHLLRAQAAQLADDRSTSRRIYESMLASPDTEALGLRGLFLEAEREGEKEAARQFAQRAVRLNPKLTWAVDALFDIQCREGNWKGALDTLSIARKHGHIEKPVADRRRAVLLTAQAQEVEDSDPERALALAQEAHKLAVDLVPAAAIAGRALAARGNTPKATGVIQKTWRKSPHPELAVAYAYARLGDSPKDRLDRVRQLAALTPNVIESPIAIANAAIEAKDFDAAREALAGLIEDRLTQRVCTLMARIESEQNASAGGVREWLARAVNAPRDPAWTADGVVSEHWAPVSPVTGALDAFRWRVPVEAAEPRDKDLLAQKIEELVALGAPPETMLMAEAAAASASAKSTVGGPADATTAPVGSGARLAAASPRVDRPVAEDAEVVDTIPARPAPRSGTRETVAETDAPTASGDATGSGSTSPSDAATPSSEPVAKGNRPPAETTRAAENTDGAADVSTAPREPSRDGREAKQNEADATPPVVKPSEMPPAHLKPTESKAGKSPDPATTATPTGAKGTEDASAAGSGKPSSTAATSPPSSSSVPTAKPEDDAMTRKVSPAVDAGVARKEESAELNIFVAPRAPDDPGPDEKSDDPHVRHGVKA